MATRNASASWEGGLKGGTGRFDGESGAIGAKYDFGSRFGDGGGTNPEELLAAAEAACFSMALAAGLEKAGHAPTRVETKAACTVEKVGDGFQITSIRLRTRANVPGIDDAAFQQIAAATKEGCPVSKALAAVDIQLEATLES
jgi:osmotically inducible protein OsmC